jgi:hypothetical protein
LCGAIVRFSFLIKEERDGTLRMGVRDGVRSIDGVDVSLNVYGSTVFADAEIPQRSQPSAPDRRRCFSLAVLCSDQNQLCALHFASHRDNAPWRMNGNSTSTGMARRLVHDRALPPAKRITVTTRREIIAA